MNDVVAWLESPEGEQWSRARHEAGHVALVAIKPLLGEIEYNWYWIWVA